MRHDLLSDVLYVVNNAEKFGKKEVTVPASNLVKNVLEVIRRAGYVKSYEFIEDGKSGSLKIELAGKINQARAIKPRFSAKTDDFEKWEARYLPAEGFGILIVSTPEGVMNQKEAMEKGLGGKLIAYIY